MFRAVCMVLCILMGTSWASFYEVVEQEPGRIVLDFTFPAPVAEEDTAGERRVTVPGLAPAVVGAQEVPYPTKQLLLALPQRKDVRTTIEVHAEHTHGITGNFQDDTGYVELPANTHLGPIQPLEVRGVQLQQIHLSPLSHDGSRLAPRSIHTARLTIEYPPVTEGQRLRQSDYTAALERSVLNPAELRKSAQPPRTLSADAASAYVSRSATVLHFDHAVEGNLRHEESAVEDINGVYRFTGAELAELGEAIPIQSITVRASNRDVYSAETPDYGTIPPGLVDVPVIVRDHGNTGVLDPEDEVLIPASAVNYWVWQDNDWTMNYSDFDYRRHYWISIDTGTVMESYEPSSAENFPVEQTGRVYRRIQQSNALETFDSDYATTTSRRWKWITLNQRNNSFRQNLAGRIFSPAEESSVGIRFGFTNVDGAPRFGLSFGGRERSPLSWSAGKTPWYEAERVDEAESFEITFQSGGLGDLWYYDLFYDRSLDFSGASTALTFYSRDASSQDGQNLVEYQLENLPEEYTLVLRENSRHGTMKYVGKPDSGGTFAWADTLGMGLSYHVIPESQFLHTSLQRWEPPAITSPFLIPSLHTHRGEYDYLILTTEYFFSAAEELAELKSSQGMRPGIILVEDVFREFAGGMRCLSAIRNGLRRAFEDLGMPSYLTLFGMGHYDYKGYRTDLENHIPPYISRSSGSPVLEEFFAYFRPGDEPAQAITGGNIPALFVGRIPANTRAEARAYLAKLRTMDEKPPEQDDFRNRVLFLSDDDTQRGRPENLQHWQRNNVFMNTLVAQDPAYDLFEVNLLEYPFSSGWTKPGARSRFLSELNRGTMMVSFFGHGSNRSLTDEGVFGVNDISFLENRDNYFLFAAFSCAVSFFDNHELDNIGTRLVLADGRGAIATIGSTRESWDGSNATFGRRFSSEFFTPQNGEVPTVGMAFGQARLGANRVERYALMGDPAYRPHRARPTRELEITTVDGEPAHSAAIFDRLTLSGELPPELAGAENVRYTVAVQNPIRHDVERKDLESAPADVMRTYDLPGDMVYHSGVLESQGTALSHTIQIPRSIAQVDSGVTFRMYAWAKDSPDAFVAYTDTLPVEGINYDEIDTTDTEGPSIAVRLQPSRDREDLDQGFISEFVDAPGRIEVDGFVGDTSFPIINDRVDTTIQNFISLEILLRDTSGIDHFYDKPGEGITVEIDGVMPLRVVNEEFESLAERDRAGRITLFVPRSSVPRTGEYTFTVAASDILGNRTRKQYVLDITSLEESQYTLGEVFAFPSPARMGEYTRFWFNEPGRNVGRTELKIFTLDGQLVKRVPDVRPGYTWDLRDARGTPLSPNVYLYRLYAERDTRARAERFHRSDASREDITSSIKKLIIYPPR
ncbi:C25 family cysteine peptidase [Chitinivibrio alkaliphilus]|uniref:Gingipain domain-containing protein n=1 Tax=Chitinivibrio alkaliphilus ACht1 TaxID=1313304 RepID=U7D5I9_9BACT|nr:C25 family cysteine peptidase [Chitinivibrio alkaliphilus]ERP31794.1 hypothetical protein CALK_1237 [Chitinivibrio alkaliphilus ACht1]